MSQLKYAITYVDDLTEENKIRMFDLMNQFYKTQEETQFRKDLSTKQFVILLVSLDEVIQGFSTVALNPAGTSQFGHNIYYSGDTILHPDYWGSQELVKGFFHLVYSIQIADPSRKLYWFLLSKGHRTYMYLPLFFHSYYPGIPDREDPALYPVLNAVATHMFGDQWKPDTGLIHIPNDGAMTDELSEASFRKHGEHVRFFLERNPDFQQGRELACLVDLQPENFLPMAQRIYGNAKMLTPVEVDKDFL